MEAVTMKKLTVYGGCYDGKNRVIVAAPTKKAAHAAVKNVLGGISYYAWDQYTSDTGNEVELQTALAKPLAVFSVSINGKTSDYKQIPTDAS